MPCCQVVVFEAHSGSDGRRFLSTPWQIITSLGMRAPTACTFGLPAPTSRAKKALGVATAASCGAGTGPPPGARIAARPVRRARAGVAGKEVIVGSGQGQRRQPAQDVIAVDARDVVGQRLRGQVAVGATGVAHVRRRVEWHAPAHHLGSPAGVKHRAIPAAGAIRSAPRPVVPAKPAPWPRSGTCRASGRWPHRRRPERTAGPPSGRRYSP